MPCWFIVIGRHLFGVVLYALSAWIAWRLWHRFPWEYGEFEVKEGLYALAGDFTLAVWSVPGYAFTLIRPSNNSNKQGKWTFVHPILSGLLMGGGLQAWVLLGWTVNDWLAAFFHTQKDTGPDTGLVWLIITFMLAPLLASIAAAWLSAMVLRNIGKPQ